MTRSYTARYAGAECTRETRADAVRDVLTLSGALPGLHVVRVIPVDELGDPTAAARQEVYEVAPSVSRVRDPAPGWTSPGCSTPDSAAADLADVRATLAAMLGLDPLASRTTTPDLARRVAELWRARTSVAT